MPFLWGSEKINIERYKEENPALDLQDFFNGYIKAYGIVQDWRGRVARRLDMSLHGEWSGDEGRLHEEFFYYDGEEQVRNWDIKKISETKFEGCADDIIGSAKGKICGNTAHWLYEATINVGGKDYKVSFDDWMFLMRDGVMLNRSYIKKFGLTVAEVSIVMQKLKS